MPPLMTVQEELFSPVVHTIWRPKILAEGPGDTEFWRLQKTHRAHNMYSTPSEAKTTIVLILTRHTVNHASHPKV